jgi:hypothetical protein
MSQLFHPRKARGRAAWLLLGAMMGVLALSCLLRAEAARASALADRSATAGHRMFFGDASLQGAIVGHPEALPARLVACANCHLGGAGLGAASFGPQLDGPRMTEMRGRRGGPPSAFSPTSFCRMLRTGVDPASILITRQMPRYTLDDNQCLGLWHYLTETSDVGSN